jgi:hypothetical protein
MTPDQLSAIRARLDAATPGPWVAEREAILIAHAPTDLRALLDEVERLSTQLHASQAEVAELHADPLPAARWVREVERAAFARGAEAMRTALLQRVSWGSDLADCIRNEPVPEDR